MAMAELPKPGVEVIQEFSSFSPTIAAPALVPCIVGVCKQIIEITNSDGTINSDAAVSSPAVANADSGNDDYIVNGLTLSLSIDSGPTQTKTIDTGTGAVTAQTLANAINTAGYTGVWAYTWTSPLGEVRVQLRTTSTGSAKTITFKGGTIASQLGWDDAIGYTWYGISTYTQSAVFLPQASFPDPRDIMDDLDIDETTVNCYVDLGSSIQELTPDSTFLYGDFGNGTITIENDNDGDSSTPFIDLEDASGVVNFAASPSFAEVTGGDIQSADVRVHNLPLAVEINGGGRQIITLLGKPIVSDAASATWTFPLAGTLTLLVNGVTINIALTSADLAATITDINTATQTAVGYDVAYECNATGIAGASDYLGLWVGAVPTTLLESTEVSVTTDGTGEIWATVPVYQSNDDTGLATVVDPIQTQINNSMNETIAYVVGTDLVLRSSTSGHDSKIKIVGAPDSSTDLLTALGLTAGDYFGTSFKVRAGDTLYGDNAEIGTVTEVHPGGNQGRLRISPEVSITSTWSSWYIIANNLENEETEWGSTVPYPDFYLDTAGDAHIKHDFLRDSLGSPLTGAVGLYLTYQAVRKDVTSEATTGTPALVVFEDVDELEEAIGPIQPANPLAYGIFQAISNAANTQITGLGIAETSAGEPYGTLTAWGKAFDFLATEEVYAIAIMDDNPLVHQFAKVHVEAMSQPEQKAERVAIICQDRPTREYDSIAVSGTNGESTAATKFDTQQPTITSQLQNLGLDPNSLSASDGVYLDVESDNYFWNITSIEDGTVVVINQTFGPGENDDLFYEENEAPPDDLINETFSVKVRGNAIPDSTAGRNVEVETYVNIGQGYSTRRVWHLISNGAYASVDGVISLVEGFFLCAAKAGQVAGNLPSAPLTNFSISGFTGVVGTNDRYTESQMNQIAYGGNDIIVQPGAGSPLVSRHQLTTNMASIEVREQSIVKAVDFCAKFIRTGLRNFIGKFNITETFLDTISAVVQGQVRYLSDNGIIAGGDLNNIIQDTTNPDTVLVDVTIEVLYPCNYIRVTLII